MDIRKDFREIQSYFERLLVYANEFYKYQKDWVKLKNDDYFEKVYDLPHKDKIRIENIYSKGRQFGIDINYNLTIFNDVGSFPTLKSYIDHLETNWLNHYDYLESVITNVEKACEELSFNNWNVNQMIILHKKQMNLFNSLFTWVNQIKETNLYKSELKAEHIIDISKTEMEKLDNYKKDLFICHSSEDKIDVVEPLLQILDKEKINYWYDSAEIKWGDSLIKKVNDGLSKSKYVLVIISKNFIDKSWPNTEMEAALNLEYSSGITKVLPLLIGEKQTIEDIKLAYPIINQKLFFKWSDGLEKIIEALRNRLN